MKPTLASGGCDSPRYPLKLQMASVTGQVTASFIVSAAGRMEPGSVQVLFATLPEFVPPALASIQSCRFRPGEIDGVPVRVRTKMTITFRISGVPD